MNRFALTISILASTAVAACSNTTPQPPERTSNSASPIINGSKDNIHPSTVALQGNIQGGTFSCSGTLLQVTGTTGYVLTAAHCCDPASPPLVVDIGPDYGNPTAEYNIIQNSITQHPAYDANNVGLGHDFCMLQFSGADNSLVTMPALPPGQDNIGAGSIVDISGYGVTANNQMNTLREHLPNTSIESADALLLEIDNSTSGQCHGDSGGPWISNVGGTNFVVGVTSFGNSNASDCGGNGAKGDAGRVSAAYNSFINPYLTGQPAQPTCQDCAAAAEGGNGGCHNETAACQNNQDCVNFVNCINPCQSQACLDACVNQHAQGSQLYNTLINCICTSACVNECQAECGGGSSSSSSSGGTTTSSSGGSTTSSSGGSTTSSGGSTTSSGGAGGGNTSSGAGGANTGSTGTGKNNPGDETTYETSCSTGHGSSSSNGLWLFGALAGAAAFVRRRRS
jgi:MYXO-CTERM domain-containing protein